MTRLSGAIDMMDAVGARDTMDAVGSKDTTDAVGRIDAKRRAAMMAPLLLLAAPPSVNALPTVDVNNAVAREFSALPGTYPTIATKLIKRGPFNSKAEMYAALDSAEERERLKSYDKFLKIAKTDSEVKRYKESQICKYECKGGGSEYRAKQIRSVQQDRRF